MNKILIAFFMVFLMQQCIATCSDNQININSASKEQLDELYGIGPVKAEAIINSRSFENIDDLIKVSGIGEITLKKIKEQGLACVENKDNYEVPQQINEEPKEKYNLVDEKDEKDEEPEKIELEVIMLNTKNIKSKDNEEKLEEPNKSKYAVYGFAIFCVLLGALFIIKNKYRKNEFK